MTVTASDTDDEDPPGLDGDRPSRRALFTGIAGLLALATIEPFLLRWTIEASGRPRSRESIRANPRG